MLLASVLSLLIALTHAASSAPLVEPSPYVNPDSPLATPHPYVNPNNPIITSPGRGVTPAYGLHVPRVSGTVDRRSEWHVHLSDGIWIDLNDHTVILPTGGTIRIGQPIVAYGNYETFSRLGRPTILAIAVVIQ
jgi:hypothetical protein